MEVIDMKNKKGIIAVVAILLVIMVVAVIIKINSSTDVEENKKNIETALITTTPTSAPIVVEETEDNSIDEFIANIDVVPEAEQEKEKIIPLSTKEVIYKEPVIEKTEPTEAPIEEPKEVEPTKEAEEVKETPAPTKAPEKEEVKATPTPTKKPVKEDVKITPVPTKAPEEVKTSETIKVAGINFPVLDSFNKKNISTNSWGDDNASIDAINAFNEYIPSVTGDPYTGLVDYGHKLTMSVLDSSSYNLSLSKDEDEKKYVITLYASLEQSAYADDDSIAKLNRDTLLMFCSLVSSTPQKMYSIIYDSFETDETHGLSTETYKSFGDFQIKYSIASDKKSVSYYVKAK
jgi:hypothetical protein